MMRTVTTMAREDREGYEYELVCSSCGCRGDLVIPLLDDEEPLCRDCLAPLHYLDFPEDYCDLGEGD